MIEAAMIWNEPNNKSHWDPELDPDWSIFARTAIEAARAIAAANPDVKRVLGGISPIDPHFIERMKGYGVLDHVDVTVSDLGVVVGTYEPVGPVQYGSF